MKSYIVYQMPLGTKMTRIAQLESITTLDALEQTLSAKGCDLEVLNLRLARASQANFGVTESDGKGNVDNHYYRVDFDFAKKVEEDFDEEVLDDGGAGMMGTPAINI